MVKALCVALCLLGSSCGFLDDEIVAELGNGEGYLMSGRGYSIGCGGARVHSRRVPRLMLGEPDIYDFEADEIEGEEWDFEDDDIQADLLDEGMQRAARPVPDDALIALFVDAEKEVDTVFVSAQLREDTPAD